MSLGTKLSLYLGAPSSGSISGRVSLFVNGINPNVGAKLPLYIGVSGPTCPLSWETDDETWNVGENIYSCVDNIPGVGRKLPMYIKVSPVGKIGAKLGLFIQGACASKLPLYLYGNNPVGQKLSLYCFGQNPTTGKLSLWLGANIPVGKKLSLMTMGI